MSDFYTFNNRYFIRGELVLDTPIHIGMGVSLEPVGTDLPVIKTPDGKPYIPGSSVKGVLRSEFERILRTLGDNGITINGKTVWACNILEEKEKCIFRGEGNEKTRGRSLEKLKEEARKEAEEEGKSEDTLLAEKISENLCTACSLFGSTEFGSRVYFKDMFLTSGTPIRIEIRDGIAIDRDTGTVKEGFKFDYEIIPKGASFGFEMVLENVEEWELGLIGLLIKLWEKGNIALGGKTSTGLGWGTLRNVIVKKVDTKNLLDYLVDGKEEEVDLNEIVSDLRNKIKGGS
ncbi:MAG: type III CRISPR-associated RAMP protein Csx7 [Candidatus Freyarchaeota archaeon]